MSCSICGQDVPVVPADDAQIVTCLRCRNQMLAKAMPAATRPSEPPHRRSTHRSSTAPTALHLSRPPRIAHDDDWEDENVETAAGVHETATSLSANVRVDLAQDAAPRVRTRQRGKRHRSHWLPWTILSLGVTLFSCGATLVAWSFGDDHHHLWNLGAPLALAGQAAFLIGLVLQLEVIWQQSKQTQRSLDNLDQRVAPCAGSALTTPSSLESNSGVRPSAPPDPDSLLTELKGRLDHVATSLLRPKW